MFTEMFWSFMITSIIACILALAQYLFKSKCDNIECCCIKIHRSVELESNEGLPQVELPQPLQRSQTPSRGPSLDSLIRKP
jgi:hypothetical protein